MSNDLKEKFAGMSDEELLIIVNTDFANYREEALDIAKEELEKRGIRLTQTEADSNTAAPNHAELASQDHATPSAFSEQSKAPGYAYALVIVAGYVYFRLTSLPTPFYIIYGIIIGALFGKKWPSMGWKWGLWFCLPLMVFLFFPAILNLITTLGSYRWIALESDFYTVVNNIISAILLMMVPPCVSAFVAQKLSVAS